jgi:hypothetical protein
VERRPPLGFFGRAPTAIGRAFSLESRERQRASLISQSKRGSLAGTPIPTSQPLDVFAANRTGALK